MQRAPDATASASAVTIGFAAQEFERSAYEPLIAAFNQQNSDVRLQRRHTSGSAVLLPRATLQCNTPPLSQHTTSCSPIFCSSRTSSKLASRCSSTTAASRLENASRCGLTTIAYSSRVQR
jgi:hypothetical protein